MFTYSKAPLVCLLLVLAVGWSCKALEEKQPQKCGMQEDCQTGVLTGTVTKGPLSPVGGARESRPSARAAGAKLVITRTTGDKTETATTGQDGIYRIILPAGTYRVTISQLPAGQFTKDLPATVTIKPGEETRLDVRLDTGIR